MYSLISWLKSEDDIKPVFAEKYEDRTIPTFMSEEEEERISRKQMEALDSQRQIAKNIFQINIVLLTVVLGGGLNIVLFNSEKLVEAVEWISSQSTSVTLVFGLASLSLGVLYLILLFLLVQSIRDLAPMLSVPDHRIYEPSNLHEGIGPSERLKKTSWLIQNNEDRLNRFSGHTKIVISYTFWIFVLVYLAWGASLTRVSNQAVLIVSMLAFLVISARYFWRFNNPKKL